MAEPTSEKPRPPAPRSFAKRAAFAAWVCLSSAVLLEVALRVADPFGVGYFWAMRRYVANLASNPQFSYIHRPHYQDRLQGVEVSVNGEGLRWPEFEPSKPKGTVRVIVLGDSVVFGWGAPIEATFPMLLQKALRQRDARVEVIAAGVCSWNTRSELEFMKAKGFGYSPDVLLLVVYDNDIDPHEKGARHAAARVPQPQRSWPRRVIRAMGNRSYLIATALAIRGKLVAGHRDAALYGDDSPPWQNAKGALMELIQLCRERDVALAVYLDGNSDLPFTHACFEQHGKVLTSSGIPFTAATPELYRPQYCNSWVDGHANPARHRRVADAVRTLLEPLVAARTSLGVSGR